MAANGKQFRAGMPHLDMFGLSDSFCMADAGNRHWEIIAHLTGLRPSEWRTVDGARIYANFVYSNLRYERQQTVSEDDLVRVDCRPLGLKPPFVLTETSYRTAASGLLLQIVLMSALTSKVGDSNSVFCRSALGFRSAPFGVAAVDRVRNRYKEMSAETDQTLCVQGRYEVKPQIDFNAANFLYFVNYARIFKAYEISGNNAVAPLLRRETFFFGNVDRSDIITIAARSENRDTTASMTRSSDNKCIARSLSRRLLADIGQGQTEPRQAGPTMPIRELAVAER